MSLNKSCNLLLCYSDLNLDGLKISAGGCGTPHQLVRRQSSSSSTTEVDEDLLLYVGGLMLRHITQLVCNASAIYEVGPTPPEMDHDDTSSSATPSVVSNVQYRVATAIYPRFVRGLLSSDFSAGIYSKNFLQCQHDESFV